MSDVAVLTWEGCAWTEVMPVLSMIPGAQVIGTGPARVREGFTVLPTPLAHAALIVVPGGELDAAWDDEALLDAIRAAPRVAGICNGALLLARAGRLEGRRATHTAHPPYATRPEWTALLDAAEPALEGCTFVDEDVVIDGDLTTAKPWAAIEFAKTLASSLVGRDEASRQARYLRGCRDLPGEEPSVRWAAFLAPVDGVAATRAQVHAHVEHLRDLERRGRLVLAGPFADKSGGLVVFRAVDEAEANAILARDPFVAEGVRVATVRRWTLSSADNDHMGG